MIINIGKSYLVKIDDKYSDPNKIVCGKVINVSKDRSWVFLVTNDNRLWHRMIDIDWIQKL